MARFVSKGASVVIKPNIVVAKQPQFGVTTNPQALAAVGRWLRRPTVTLGRPEVIAERCIGCGVCANNCLVPYRPAIEVYANRARR